jgi:hypothetical protein
VLQSPPNGAHFPGRKKKILDPEAGKACLWPTSEGRRQNGGSVKTDSEMFRHLSWKYSEPADGEWEMRYLGWLEEEVAGKEGEQDGIAGG